MPQIISTHPHCSVDECEKPRGYKTSMCPMHHLRKWRHGDIHHAPPARTVMPIGGEVWKPVVGFEDLYAVSSLGRVQRLVGYHAPAGLMRSSLSRGYPKVSLRRAGQQKTLRVHAMMAAAFLGPCPHKGWSVNHIDGVKTNNVIANLEWVSQARQVQHSLELRRRESAV